MAWVPAPELVTAPNYPRTQTTPILTFGPPTSPPVLTAAFRPAPDLYLVQISGGDTVGYASSN